jgi:hypothetical protein
VATRSVMKVKTFQIIVLQGIIGSLPWTAIVFFTMWFELIGRIATILQNLITMLLKLKPNILEHS